MVIEDGGGGRITRPIQTSAANQTISKNKEKAEQLITLHEKVAKGEASSSEETRYKNLSKSTPADAVNLVQAESDLEAAQDEYDEAKRALEEAFPDGPTITGSVDKTNLDPEYIRLKREADEASEKIDGLTKDIKKYERSIFRGDSVAWEKSIKELKGLGVKVPQDVLDNAPVRDNKFTDGKGPYEKDYTVKAADTRGLWGISEDALDHFGIKKPTDPNKMAAYEIQVSKTAELIYQKNKDLIGPDKNLIKPGQKLAMPDIYAKVVAPGETMRLGPGGNHLTPAEGRKNAKDVKAALEDATGVSADDAGETEDVDDSGDDSSDEVDGDSLNILDAHPFGMFNAFNRDGNFSLLNPFIEAKQGFDNTKEDVENFVDATDAVIDAGVDTVKDGIVSGAKDLLF